MLSGVANFSLDSGAFTYLPETKTFISDASTLELYGWITQRVIHFKGRKETVKFNYVDRICDDEGETLFWQYKGKHKGKTYKILVANT